jgi:hypothetical protein
MPVDGGQRVLHDGECAAIRDVPLLPMAEFRRRIVQTTAARHSLLVLFGVPSGDGLIRLVAVLGNRTAGELELLMAEANGAYAALTPDCSQAASFEREIARANWSRKAIRSSSRCAQRRAGVRLGRAVAGVRTANHHGQVHG